MRNALVISRRHRVEGQRFDVLRSHPRGMGSIVWGTRNRGMGSIVWGTRGLRGLGVTLPGGTTTDFNTGLTIVGPIPQELPPPVFPGNPDTQPGAWPGLNIVSGGCIIGPDGKSVCQPIFGPIPRAPQQTNGSPGQVPVVVTPASGPIPPPQTVAAATAPPPSWLDQEMIGGIPNKFLLLGGLGAFLMFGGKKR